MATFEEQKHIIEVINDYKYFAGISIAELANRIGADKKRIGYVLRNERRIYGAELVKLCVYFGISIDEIKGQQDYSSTRQRNGRDMNEESIG